MKRMRNPTASFKRSDSLKTAHFKGSDSLKTAYAAYPVSTTLTP